MSSTMPVVWCTDPNSSEKRQPFALQGIQLQGNITEKHVLAMKELISFVITAAIVPKGRKVLQLFRSVGRSLIDIDDNDSNAALLFVQFNSSSNKSESFAIIKSLIKAARVRDRAMM
ncbi:hypothetical protein RP20_CCG025128 [Aedes albopictus]|nr:hypothetical protein RP20_CCG025128 [Aedes albopictus]